VSSRQIDADHSGFSQIDSVGQADDVFPSYLSLLGPVVTHQIDDKVTWFHCFDTRTDFENAANALGPQRGREIEPNPVDTEAMNQGLYGSTEFASMGESAYFSRPGASGRTKAGAIPARFNWTVKCPRLVRRKSNMWLSFEGF
jgi:hypothetical protein